MLKFASCELRAASGNLQLKLASVLSSALRSSSFSSSLPPMSSAPLIQDLNFFSTRYSRLSHSILTGAVRHGNLSNTLLRKFSYRGEDRHGQAFVVVLQNDLLVSTL